MQHTQFFKSSNDIIVPRHALLDIKNPSFIPLLEFKEIVRKMETRTRVPFKGQLKENALWWLIDISVFL